MATYERKVGKKSIGLGGLVLRLGLSAALLAGGMKAATWTYDKVTEDNAPIEQGFVNPKNLDIQSRKNAAGSIESYLQFKNGDSAELLPCTSGYNAGVVCGTVDYIVENFSPGQREGIVVGQFPSISNDAKRGIVGVELQTMLDAFYDTQKPAQQQQPASQYNNTKK